METWQRIPEAPWENGDFVQLRIAREKKRKQKKSILARSDRRLKSAPHERAELPTTSKRGTAIDVERRKFMPLEENEIETVETGGKFKETGKSEQKKSILDRSDSRFEDALHGKAELPTTSKPLTSIYEVRSELFKAVEDNDTEKVKLRIHQLKKNHQVKITSQVACDPETNQNIWHFALLNSKKNIIDYLLNNTEEDLIMSDYNIHRSGIQGKHNALHILIEKRENEVELVETILNRIISREKKLQLMKQETAIPTQGHRPRTLSCLHLAAYHNQEKLVELFLNKGMDVNHNTDTGKHDTALLWAARWGNDKAVESLLCQKTIQIDHANDKKTTALYWAVRYEHVGTVGLLLNKGKANPNTKRETGLVAPLVVASAYGNNEIVKLLLARPKCDVNIQIRGGERPIHYAAREGYIEVLSSLLESDALFDEQDELGDTPLLLAAQNGHVELVYKLIEIGADVFHRNHEGKDIWYYAIEREDNDLLDKLLAACDNKKVTGIEMTSRRPLYIAADRGRTDKIDFLLNRIQDPLVRDSDENTFLHYAAMNNKYKVIKKFHNSIPKDVKVEVIPIDTRNKFGNTPLHIACRNGYDKTVKTLLKCKAKADVQNTKKETALHAAAYSKDIAAKTVGKLVRYTNEWFTNAVLNATDCMGRNSLHIAGKHATPEVIREFQLLRLKDCDNYGKTPLHEAVRPGEPECLNMMLDIFENMNRDARINEQTQARNETVLHLAADAGLSSCVKRLIDLGADLAMQDADKNTVLHRLSIATVLNPRHLKQHLEVVDTVFNGVVKWWCIHKNIVYPEKNDRSGYLALQKEATLYLMNDVFNKDSMSVLALCFEVGAADMISRLLMMPDVTMFEVTTREPDKRKYMMFDISHLTPRTNNSLKGYCRSNKDSPLNKDSSDRDNIGGNEKPMSSALECLITQKDKAQAAQILDLPPIKMIEDYYTSMVLKTFALIMLFHVVYMSMFTYIGVDLLSKLRDNGSGNNSVLLYIIVPIEPAIIIIYALIRFKITEAFVWRFEFSRKRCAAYVKSVISAHMLSLVCVVYIALIIAWIVLFLIRYEFQDCILAVALCIGWLLSIFFTRGFKMIHYFYRMLLSMMLRDVFRFIIVYFFVLLAFGFAFHVLFQVSSDVVQDYKTPGDTLFLSFNMMIGRVALFDDSFATNMSAVGRNVTYFKVFYLFYIILSTIILLNLLIAMMNNSHSKILNKQKVTWRIDSVSLGVDIETRLPFSDRFFNGSIVQGHEVSTKFETIPPSCLDISASDRWYVSIDRAVVDEYMRRQDIGSETAADELSSRLDELESKAEQMQEKTNAKLQQINELLEEIKAVHKPVIKIGDS